MKDLVLLKEDQEDLKLNLAQLTDFINSEEFFKLSANRQLLLKQQRVGMEIYLSALTNLIYDESVDIGTPDSMWAALLLSMFSSSKGFSSKMQ